MRVRSSAAARRRSRSVSRSARSDALHELGQTRAALTETVAEDPGAAPDDGSEEERHDGKLVLADAGGGNVDDEHADDSGGGQPQPGSRLSRIEGKEEEGDGRAERRAERVSERRSGRRWRRR